jgi:hypothetical protein
MVLEVIILIYLRKFLVEQGSRAFDVAKKLLKLEWQGVERIFAQDARR